MLLMIEIHLFALTIAFFIDLLMGDPKWLPHPVRGMGKLISFLEKFLNRGRARKLKGIVFLFFFLGIVGFLTYLVLFFSYTIYVAFGVIVEAFLISTTIATKGLRDAAIEVYLPLTEGNFQQARQNLAMIVGRDTEKLNEEEIVRGAVETVAENTSDGITAPLFWALIGGGLLAMLYRAVNTCDSMVGYKNQRFAQFGFASARFDDLLNWVPSRLSGILMILANKPLHNVKKADSFQILYRDANKHPSPNSGWLEAAMASLLAVQLGGRNTYKGVESVRALMGDPITRLQKDHIVICTKMMLKTTYSFIILLWLLGGIWLVIT